MPGESPQRHAGSDSGAAVECRILGGFDLAGGPAPEALQEICNRPKLVGLLSYLLIEGRDTPVSRDLLLAMFWPDASHSRAQHSLRQALHLLRRACGEDAVAARHSRVQLARARFRVDLHDLLKASAAGDHQTVVQLCQGELLRGVHVSGCLEFERWLDGERSRIQQQVVAAAQAWADAEREAGNPVGALRPLRQALTFAPYAEDLIAELVTILFRSGDRAGAALELQTFTTRFRADLELDPGPETLGLLDRLRAEEAVPDRRPSVARDPDPIPQEEIRQPAARSGPVHPTRGEPASLRRVERWWVGASAAVAVAIIIVVALAFPAVWRDATGSIPVLEPRRVVVVPFLNLSGDRRHDALGFFAADRIAHQLAMAGLDVIPPAASLLEASGTATPGRSSSVPGSTTGFTLAKEVGAAHLITGAVQEVGDALGFQVYLFDVARRTLQVPRMGEAGLAGEFVPAIDALGKRVTGTLAGLLDQRLASWAAMSSQPASLEVYEEFVAAIAAYTVPDSASAGRFLAVAAMDTSFTAPLIWAMLAELFGDRTPAADRVIQTLLPRRQQLPPWDRAMLDWGAATVAGDRAGRAEALGRLTTLVPESFWAALAVADALDQNSPRAALRLLARLGPDRVWYGQPWGNYFRASALAHHLLGDYQAERAVLDRWRRREDIPPPGPGVEVRALAGAQRATELSRLVSRLLTEERRPLPLSLAEELAGHGHDSLARRVYEHRLSALAASGSSSSTDPAVGLQRARTLVRLGRFEESRLVVERLLQSPGHLEAVLRGDLGIIAALQGDRATARSQAAWLARQAAQYSGGWFTARRAQIAAAMGDRDELLRLMAQAEREGWNWTHGQLHSPEYGRVRTDPDFLVFFEPRG